MKASLFLLATLPMIFADEDFKCSMGLRGADVQAGRNLQVDPMCSNGIVGIQSKNSCCAAGCGQCGGSGCSTIPGFTADDCCESAVQMNGKLCEVTAAAPCIIDAASTPPPVAAPPVVVGPPEGTCEGGIPGIQSKLSCCVLACGQCGGSGCSTAGGLTSAECCESGVASSGVLCEVSGAAPCVVDAAGIIDPIVESSPIIPSLPDGMCAGGIVGIQSKDVCCMEACGQCGGSGCSTVGGFGSDKCCEGGVRDTGVMCADSGVAPCVLGGASVPVPDPIAVAPTVPTPVAPTTPAPISEPKAGAVFIGCFADLRADRMMENVSEDPEMTTEMCEAICSEYEVFGTQFGVQCWCGGNHPDTATYGEPIMAACDMPCPGNPETMCGGRDTMSVYEHALTEPTGAHDHGCFADSFADRIMERVLIDDFMTTEMCEVRCDGSRYYGTQYGTECWCSVIDDIDAFRHGESTLCTYPCGGNVDQLCGGELAMNIYEK